ncbi:FtsX-like permease family protein [Streptomyces sp. AP-93]|uniref:ABC transporter permease n=1 Tax=Streptomyces sp. AP-93 TaxID=2929048 RepID=UPI001FAF34C5|nr:FtsX-like permease family protein [Streptomyces sp. AP-93]MCJ0871772.1 ABC transporter permease [Streptomyces sp. AP-93]
MLSVALRTMRTRWVTFVGSFIALALGVGLLATMGLTLASTFDAPERSPERFASAASPVVVRGPDTLRVPSPIGDRVKPLTQPPGLDPQVSGKLAGLGRTTVDRTFDVHVGTGPKALDGHPWSVAAFAPYRLLDGRAPAADSEVVVAKGTAKTGDRVEVRTDSGSAARTVVGTVKSTGFENPVFFSDAEAARLSPRIDNIVVDAPVEAVKSAVAGTAGVQVLSGENRRLADPDPDREKEALLGVNILIGTAGGVTTFTAVFVVASTFAFAVAQRRREFGLLRTAGATPGQVRRMVFAEATVIGVLASAAGCVLGAYGAPYLARVLVDNEVAPSWFAIKDASWPYWIAFSTGLLVAMAGVWAASRRAGKVTPAEALRDAAVDTRTMTPGRWVWGGLLLLAGTYVLGSQLISDPQDAIHRKTYTIQPMWWITAFACLAPVLVRPLTRLLAWLPAQLPGAVGMLMRENAASSVRRTAAIVAPVLVAVALAGSLLGVTGTINEAKAAETNSQLSADYVISSGGGIDDRSVERVKEVAGVTATGIASSGIYTMEDGVALIQDEARAVDPAALPLVADLPVIAGRAADLDDGSIIVTDEWAKHTVGESVDVWLGDGSKTSLKIVAVMRTGTGNNGVYVTPHNAPGATASRIDVKLRPGADAAVAAAALKAAAEPFGGKVLTKQEWEEATAPKTNRQTRVGFAVVLGIALLYSCIALANTLVMATADRVRDLAVLRLAGATKAQVLRLVAAESLMVVVVGGALGLAVTGLYLFGVWACLAVMSVWSPVAVPWQALGGALGVCALLAVTFSTVPAALALRTRPVELAGMRE